jgi:hypothetical protein
MHATKWIVRLVVIELRDRPNRAPAHRRVTIFARNRQRPMRAPRGLVLLARDRMRSGRHRIRRIAVSAGEDQQGPENELEYGSRNSSPYSATGHAVEKGKRKFPRLLWDRRTVATVLSDRFWPLH